ncbi:hypothetical protein HDV01_003122 [Terramyces sp. JEL0728]|nr:hypothetical protein HDV01_003122 [Terramyces sp. JEL0728]
MDNDEIFLEKLGYKQELKRELTSFSNFAVSFTIISILTGINSLFTFGLTNGGPVGLVWGWTLVAFFSGLISLSMAEICSAYPTSGGLYFWSAQLAGKQHAPVYSWITGWFNLIGQVATTAGIDFGLATFILNVIASNSSDYVPVAWHNLLLYLAILVVHGLLNTFANRIVKILCDVSVWWHIFGTLVIVVVILVKAPQMESAGFVFTTFNKDPTAGLPGDAYVFFIGLLTAQYTFTGFDASAHMTEETKNAAVAGPVGIVLSVVISFFAGLFYIVGLLFAMPDIATTIKGGLPAIFANSVGQTGSNLLSIIVMGAMFFAGMSSLTANSRMMFAFARDGALPLSHVWHTINPDTKTPVGSVWLGVLLCFVLGQPVLTDPTRLLSDGVPVAFTAITSIAVIGLYISYVIPVFLRLTISKKSFVPGPFHLGRFSPIVGWISVLWVAFITVLFVLPTSLPNDLNSDAFKWVNNLNYAGPMVVFFTLLFMVWWAMDARHWFKGPKIIERNISSLDVETPRASQSTIEKA